jgi:hypothetical protein
MVAVRFASTSEPPVADLFPDQPPDAVQVVALVTVQVSVLEAPLATVAGAAVSPTFGLGFCG